MKDHGSSIEPEKAGRIGNSIKLRKNSENNNPPVFAKQGAVWYITSNYAYYTILLLSRRKL